MLSEEKSLETVEQSAATTTEESATTNPRKRRNRWGESQDNPNDSSTNSLPVPSQENNNEQNNNDSKEEQKTDTNEENARKRKSRWSQSEGVPKAALLPGINGGVVAPVSEEVVQQTIVLKLQLAQVNQKLLTVAQDALLIEQDPNRSPSPPPKYDSSGKRTNTREVRMREALNQQRITIIEELMKLNPTFLPPMDFIKAKPFRKIYIPKNNDPTCNYIGLIIGPRGNTQKQMEQETQCKISIRGKGSAKEGSKGRQNKQQIDEDDDLHVHIQGDTEENVEKAAKMIDAILRPLDDKLNEHKQRQLRELALINGTFKVDDYCPICGEKGHRQFDCPFRAKSFKAAGVKCSICGDLSHPTRDCPMREQGGVNEKNIDSEYDNFLAELGEKPKSATGGTTAGEAKGKEGSTESMTGGGVIPPPKKGQGPVELKPIVDVVSRNPALVNMTSMMTSPTAAATSLNTFTAPAVSTVDASAFTSPVWQPPAATNITSPVPTTAAAAAMTSTAAYTPYAYATAAGYDYSAYYAAAAGYDPAAYAAYLAQYNQYAAYSQSPPPPPPPSNN